MKKRLKLLHLTVIILCFLCRGASALVVFDIKGPGGVGSYELHPGDSLDLTVDLSTSASELIGGVNYTLEFDADDWTLNSRDYATYGWLHNDGTYDNSTPLPADLPDIIDNALFPSTPAIPDFSLNTGRSLGDEVTGIVTIEDFTITVPETTPNGVYEISFGDTFAYESDGTPLSASGGTAFQVIAIPEPSSLFLLLTGIFLFCPPHRRK